MTPTKQDLTHDKREQHTSSTDDTTAKQSEGCKISFYVTNPLRAVHYVDLTDENSAVLTAIGAYLQCGCGAMLW